MTKILEIVVVDRDHTVLGQATVSCRLERTGRNEIQVVAQAPVVVTMREAGYPVAADLLADDWPVTPVTLASRGKPVRPGDTVTLEWDGPLATIRRDP